jgi:hypothetical protein
MEEVGFQIKFSMETELKLNTEIDITKELISIETPSNLKLENYLIKNLITNLCE